jgi:hypothetical protein
MLEPARNEPEDGSLSTRLPFAPERVCLDNPDRAAMDRSATDIAIQSFLVEVRNRLDEAAGIAKAAEACAGAGNLQKAIEVVLDIEQTVYEVSRLLDAASLLQRIKG